MESFMLKSLDVTFENNSDIKVFIAQFQPYCKKLLCVVNDKTLKFYTKKEELPKNIKYLNVKINEYYFEDLDTHDIYCIFGKDASTIFYPELNDKSVKDIKDIKDATKDAVKPFIVTYSTIEPKSIIIYHQGKKHETKWINREIEMIESNVFKNI
jgi:hypothetical protein